MIDAKKHVTNILITMVGISRICSAHARQHRRRKLRAMRARSVFSPDERTAAMSMVLLTGPKDRIISALRPFHWSNHPQNGTKHS